MPIDPNENDPKQPNRHDLPPLPPPDDGPIFDLAEEAAEPEPEAASEVPEFEAGPITSPVPAPPEGLPDLAEIVSFDSIDPPDAPSSLTMGIRLADLDLTELTGLSDVLPAQPLSDVVTAEPASDVHEIPSTEPISSDKIPVGEPIAVEPASGSAIPLATGETPGSSVQIASVVDEPDAVGNFEPIAPVAPASGWLETLGDAPQPLDAGLELAEPLSVQPADLFDAPPPIESSDIFASGPIPTATSIDHSDVIAATAFGPAKPVSGAPARHSDVALNFDQPPGGSTISEIGAGGDLPVADEVDSDPSMSELVVPDRPSAVLRPTPPEDLSDFGSTPIATPDASSILSDLSDPGEIQFDESSAVRIESPGIGRTHSSEEGTEFDLTITDDPVLPELDAAELESGEDATDWRQQSGSNLFADSRTVPEIEIEEGQVEPVDPKLSPEDPSLTSSPSSIFSGGKAPAAPGSKTGSGPSSDSVRIGRPSDEEDAAVEFSDHPTADLESSSAALAGPLTPTDGKHPIGEIDFDERPESVAGARPEDRQDSGRVDWSAAALDDSEEASVGFPQAMLGESLSSILKREKERIEQARAEEDRTRVERPMSKGAKPVKGEPVENDESDPSVEIDWMAGSSTEEPVAPEVLEPEKKKEKIKGKDKDKKKEGKKEKTRSEPRKVAEKEQVRKGKGGWVGGTFLGMVMAGGACAGLYFGGVIPAPSANDNARLPPPNPAIRSPQEGGVPPATLADARAALDAGDPARAIKVLDAVRAAAPDKNTVETKAAMGQARLFARLHDLPPGKPAAGDDPELKKAREELQSVVDDAGARKTPEGEKAAVEAAVRLGLTFEVAGDRKKARQIYDDGLKNFPKKYEAIFQSQLDRMDSTAPADGQTRQPARLDVEAVLFALVLLEGAGTAADDSEAGVFFWKAVKLAGGGKYVEAVEEIGKARAAHVKQSRTLAGRGLNPLSDPLEQIFPRCCDDLKAYWELRAAVYSNKSVADLIEKQGASAAMTELAAAQKKAVEAVKLMTDLKDMTDKLAKSQKDLKDAQEDFAVKEKDFLAKIKVEQDKAGETADKLATTESNRKKLDDVVTALAKELQAGKLLPEKYDTAALLAAQKTAADRATGPTLTALAPPGMMAVAGGPLTSGQLIDVADRLVKAESTAKIATDKLATETRKLADTHAAELKKLTEGNEAAVKKLKEDHAAETKKLTDGYTAATTKLKEEQAAELKKAADKNAADLKKLTDDNTAATKKLTEGFEGKIKDLEAVVVKTKADGDAVATSLRADLKNSVTPAQALDLWLPQLTELRRASDCDPALANAAKVLASSPPASEDMAKAHTVTGLALLLKGNLPEAKEHFVAASSSPAYKTSTGKEWVNVADLGLESITDPLAPYRLPVEKPRRNVKLAAKHLDDGIKAYKLGRPADAAAALIEATKADPTDPLSWYFLGAARWATGARDQAEKDFRQGSEWERLSPLTSRAISSYIEAIQGPARDALTTARP